MNSRRRQALLLLGYLSSILFTLGVTIAPTKGYHPNIYRAVPLFVWGLFVVGLITGFVSCYSAIRARSRRDFIRSVLLIGCLYLVFWFFPMQTGLRFWTPPRGDLLMHFGEAKAIVATHSIPELNIYPLSHVLLAELHFVSALRMGVFGPLLSGMYYAILIAGVWLVARRYGNRRVGQYVLLAALPLVFNKYTHAFMPWMLTFSLIPLVFVLFDIWRQTSNQTQRGWISLAGILLLLFFLIGHPMSGMVAVGVIFGGEALSVLVSWWRDPDSVSAHTAPSTWAFISLLVYPMWYISQLSFQRKFATIVLSMVGATAGSASQKISRAGGSGLSTMTLLRDYVIGKWGTLFVYLGVAGLIWCGLAYRFLRRRGSVEENIMTGMFAGGGVFAVFLLVFNFIASDPYRVNQVTLVMAFFVIGGALYWLTDRGHARRHTVARACLVVVIIGAAIWSPFTIYDETKHVAESEFVGTEHHLEFQNLRQQTKSMQMAHVLTTYLVGSHADPSWEQWSFVLHSPDHQLPKHLGYADNATFKQAVGPNVYAITKTRDYTWWRDASASRRKMIVFYTRQDTAQLATDPTVNRLYSNGNYTIWST